MDCTRLHMHLQCECVCVLLLGVSALFTLVMLFCVFLFPVLCCAVCGGYVQGLHYALQQATAAKADEAPAGKKAP